MLAQHLIIIQAITQSCPPCNHEWKDQGLIAQGWLFWRQEHLAAIIKYCQTMSASDITRKRLNSLKALTEQLKDRTKNAPLDLSHIRELLSNTRQLHTSQAHRPPIPDPGDNLQSDSSLRPLFPERQKNGQSEEVILLRQENVALEQKISQLKAEIGQLQEDRRKLEVAAQHRMNQGFKISDSVQGFVGRLALPAENYDRLQYSAYDIELQLDKIVLLRREKGAVQEFSLQGLKGAEYCGTTVIVLRFQEFLEETSSVHPLTSVFLKFYSEDQLKKWDVALYSNYHIVYSLDQKRLFERYFRCVKLEEEARKQDQRIKAIRQSGELDHDKEKDLLKLLVQKREEYKEVQKLIREKLEHKIKANMALNREQKEMIGQDAPLQVQKPKPQPPSKPNSNQNFPSSIQKIDELQPHQEQSQKMIRLPSQPTSLHNSQMHPFHMKHTDSSMGNFIQPAFVSPEPRASRISQNLLLYSSTSGQPGNYPLTPPPFIPGSQSQLRQSKATLVNQLSLPQGRGQSYQSSLRNNSLSKIKQGQERLHSARVKLQNGYYATKYSKDGFSPHDKKVFLSLDSRKLCWSDRDKQSQYKSVPVSVLVKVDYGIVGQGILKHVKNPDARYFCVIEYYTSDSRKKTIQLGSGNMQDMKEFSTELAFFIKDRSGVQPS